MPRIMQTKYRWHKSKVQFCIFYIKYNCRIKRCWDSAYSIFLATSLHVPCLHTFWHTIPASFTFFCTFFEFNLSYRTVAVRHLSLRRTFLSDVYTPGNHNPRTWNGIDSLVVVPSICVTLPARIWWKANHSPYQTLRNQFFDFRSHDDWPAAYSTETVSIPTTDHPSFTVY